VFNIELTREFVKEIIWSATIEKGDLNDWLMRGLATCSNKFSNLDAADKKTRNQRPREGATILAVVEVTLWRLLLFSLCFVVEE
jgi:hypothetical protein